MTVGCWHPRLRTRHKTKHFKFTTALHFRRNLMTVTSAKANHIHEECYFCGRHNCSWSLALTSLSKEQAVENLDVDGAIRAACLSFPLWFHRKGEEPRLCYPFLCSNCDLKNCFVHLHSESNAAIEQDEASLVHRARETPVVGPNPTRTRPLNMTT